MSAATNALVALAAAAMLAAPSPAAGQRGGETRVVFAGYGSAVDRQGALSSALVDAGFPALPETARNASLGLMLGGDDFLVAVEGQHRSWERRVATDGRSASLETIGFIVYGAPVITERRTYVYPVVGVGFAAHTLQVTAPAGHAEPSPEAPPGMDRWLHRTGSIENDGAFLLDLGVGSHYLASRPGDAWGLVIGVRMGWTGSLAENRWAVERDTARGPAVSANGFYGRVSLGVSHRRLPTRRASAAPPARRPPR